MVNLLKCHLYILVLLKSSLNNNILIALDLLLKLVLRFHCLITFLFIYYNFIIFYLFN